MSAKNVIAKWLDKSLASPMRLTAEEHAACILHALDAAGYAVAPKEPPPSMIIRFMEQTESDAYELAIAMYKAMLTAAKDPT